MHSNRRKALIICNHNAILCLTTCCVFNVSFFFSFQLTGNLVSHSWNEKKLNMSKHISIPALHFITVHTFSLYINNIIINKQDGHTTQNSENHYISIWSIQQFKQNTTIQQLKCRRKVDLLLKSHKIQSIHKKHSENVTSGKWTHYEPRKITNKRETQNTAR